MIAGDEIIVQGAFRLNGWVGRTDILRRVETASDLGAWSYEVIDTKLARETKGGTVLQLCLYAELVAAVQGVRPKFSYVVAPWSDFAPQAYRMDDYLAYYRRVGIASKPPSARARHAKSTRTRRSTATHVAGNIAATIGGAQTIIFRSWPGSRQSISAN